MPQTALPGLGLDYDWNLGSDAWKTGMDDNLALLDNLTQPYINFQLKSVSAQPGSPTNGDAYIIGASPTGADWSQSPETEDWIAVFYTNTGWHFAEPREGWRVFDRVDNLWYQFDGTVWQQRETGPFAINNQSTNYTLAVSDANNAVVFDGSASPEEMAMTVPHSSSVDFQIGTRILLAKTNGGLVTFEGFNGSPLVTLFTPVTAILHAFNEVGTLLKIAQDVWCWLPYRHGASIRDETATGSFTLALKHSDTTVVIDTDTITIPTHANVPFEVGEEIKLLRNNSVGNATVLGDLAASPGVKVNDDGTGPVSNTLARNVTGVLTQVAIDEWFLSQ